MGESKSDILQGTLDLMVLKTLDAMGPMHGYGIARRIEQLSEEALQINQGTIYLCLIRLVQKGWIDASWGTSDNNRKAKFYAISKAGRKQLAEEAKNWERVSGVIDRLLHAEEVVMAARLRQLGARLKAFLRGGELDRDFAQELEVASRDADGGQHPRAACRPPKRDARPRSALAPPRRCNHGIATCAASASSTICSRTCGSRRD